MGESVIGLLKGSSLRAAYHRRSRTTPTCSLTFVVNLHHMIVRQHPKLSQMAVQVDPISPFSVDGKQKISLLLLLHHLQQLLPDVHVPSFSAAGLFKNTNHHLPIE